MDLHRQVLAAAERPAGARESEPHLVPRKVQARGDLVAVDMQPLGRDEQLHAAVLAGHRQPRLRAEERLVLRADLVAALDDDLADGARVTVPQPDVAEHVAVGVDVSRLRPQSHLGIRQRLEHVVLDLDRRDGPRSDLRMVRGDGRNRLAVEQRHLVREDRLVVVFETVGAAAPQVVVGDDRVHAGDEQRRARVQMRDARVRERAAQRLAPQHAVHPQVRREREPPLGLRRRVGSQYALADTRRAALAGEGGWQARRRH